MPRTNPGHPTMTTKGKERTYRTPKRKSPFFAVEAEILRLLLEHGALFAFEVYRRSGQIPKGSYLIFLKRMVENGLVSEKETVGTHARYETTAKGERVLVAWQAFKNVLES